MTLMNWYTCEHIHSRLYTRLSDQAFSCTANNVQRNFGSSLASHMCEQISNNTYITPMQQNGHIIVCVSYVGQSNSTII